MDRAVLREKLYLSGIDSHAAALARRHGLGFEVTAFCQAVMLEDADARAAAEAEAAGLEKLWLHAPFAELCPCAIDPLVRRITAERYRQTIAVARRMGIRRIVIHDGFVPFVYFPEWFVAQSVDFWRGFLPQVPADMTIALENVMDDGPEMLAEIMAGGGRSAAGGMPGRGARQYHRQRHAGHRLDRAACPMAAACPPSQ